MVSTWLWEEPWCYKPGTGIMDASPNKTVAHQQAL